MDTEILLKEAQKIIGTLIDKYHPEKIIAFGSFAQGAMTPDSDLDLCIIKSDIPESQVDRRFAIYTFLPHRKIPLDLIVYRPAEFKERLALGDPFIKTILSEGKVLYG